MSRHPSRIQDVDGSVRSPNWLEIALLILIGLMISLLVFQGIMHQPRVRTVTYSFVVAEHEEAAPLFRNL